jgi:hypothetical protein
VFGPRRDVLRGSTASRDLPGGAARAPGAPPAPGTGPATPV